MLVIQADPLFLPDRYVPDATIHRVFYTLEAAAMRETGGEILIRFKNKWVGQLTFKPDTSVRAGG
jgi:hypothetical protein